jgi:ubiquitin C-terminal hydrolase
MEKYDHISKLIHQSEAAITDIVSYKISHLNPLSIKPREPIDYFTRKGSQIRGRCKMENNCLCCYLNSALQCFKVAYPFITYLFSPKRKLNRFTYMLRKILKQLWTAPQANCFAFKKLLGGDYALPKMMDMYASISKIIELLGEQNEIPNRCISFPSAPLETSNDALRAAIRGEITRQLKGQMRNHFTVISMRVNKCSNCHMTKRKLEINCALQLTKVWDPKESSYQKEFNQYSLQSSIDELYQEQEIELTCAKCQEKRQVQTLHSVFLPPTLVIEYKMIQKNEGGFDMLNATTYLDKSQSIKINQSTEYSSAMIRPTGEYKIVATGIHHGKSCKSGHYVACSYLVNNEKWYKYNDIYVEEMKHENYFNHETVVLFLVEKTLLQDNHWRTFYMYSEWNIKYLK